MICASASMTSTPGISGKPGKCPWKNGSFIDDVLHAADELLAVGLEDAIDQQERIAVRQVPHDLDDVHRAGSVGRHA